ncbi:MAG: hypothetical protein GTN78_01350, partial [Gemmatimonadales bacterium]|nr:hypothetical protein [Gemmatimonadales bacterium]
MAFIFWLSSEPDPQALSPVPFEVEDTVAHMVLYAVLGSLLWRAVRRSGHQSLAGQPHWWAFGIGWGYGLFDEL